MRRRLAIASAVLGAAASVPASAEALESTYIGDQTPVPATLVYGQSLPVSLLVIPTKGGPPTGTAFYVQEAGGLLKKLVEMTCVAQGSDCATSATTITPLDVGTSTVEGFYGGDAIFASSFGPKHPVTVVQATPALALKTTTPAITFGDTLALTATVALAPPADALGQFAKGIALLDGTRDVTSTAKIAVVGGSTTEGVAIAGLGAGTHALSISYPGDTNVLAGTSAVVSVTVRRAPTKATLTLTAGDSGVQAVATVSAAAGPGTPGGTVRFLEGATPLATVPVTGGRASATLALAPGEHAVTATYDGAANFAASSADAGVTVAAPAAPSGAAPLPTPSAPSRSPAPVTILAASAHPGRTVKARVRCVAAGRVRATVLRAGIAYASTSTSCRARQSERLELHTGRHHLRAGQHLVLAVRLTPKGRPARTISRTLVVR